MANGQPHTHTIETKAIEGTKGVAITYGDTTVKVRRRWWNRTSQAEARVQRAIRRCIRRHDNGSQAYDKAKDRRDRRFRKQWDKQLALHEPAKRITEQVNKVVTKTVMVEHEDLYGYRYDNYGTKRKSRKVPMQTLRDDAWAWDLLKSIPEKEEQKALPS